MSPLNPYNCTIPGNQFVGREAIQQKILNGLKNGNSFAVLGGRRSGKTSLLLELKKYLSENLAITAESSVAKIVPVYLDMQQFGALNSSTIFEHLYSLIAEKVQIAAWSCTEEHRAYQDFLSHMCEAKQTLDKTLGRRWVILYLIDELDITADRLPNDQVFHNLRNLLMVSDFNLNIQLVASGVTGMQKLITSGSPLNNLRSTYLSVLTRNEAETLLNAGFQKGVLKDEVCSKLFELSGRHPCILQGLLEYAWTYMHSNNEDLTKESIERAGKDFLHEHKFFHNWWEAFSSEEHSVYQALAAVEMHEQLNEISSVCNHSEDALSVLSFHGVIDDEDPDRPFISGTLFRNWYLNKSILNPQLIESSIPDPFPRTELPTKPKRVKLFLASSLELSDTRNSIELFLRNKNDTHEQTGIYLEVLRCENFLDAMTEKGLQDEYNRAVSSCDIFVSLFKTKTGTYTNEEFEAAHKSFLDTGYPRIYTFFENALVTTDITNRDSLLSLWKFQDKLRELKHYQTNYDNLADLKLRLSEQIERLTDSGAFIRDSNVEARTE